MSKKRIIMTAAAGLASFVAAFVFAWLTKTAPASRRDELSQPRFARQETELKLPAPQAGMMGTIGVGDNEMKKAMTEKRLKSLIYETREKVREYNDKLEGLKVQEQRLQMAEGMIKKDIEELDKLQIELASTVASLKSERDKLLKSRVNIARTEKNNLIAIAATYDKMDAASASKILANMSQTKNGSTDDAVKILHYMSDRTKAKLLAELVTSEPTLAASFCQRLKQITEEE